MGCEVELEEWGCASEIKQNSNKIKAAPCKPAEVLSVYSTLAKVRAVQEREIRKFGNEGISKRVVIKMVFWQVWFVGQVGLVRVFGRKRRFPKGGWERFWWKKGVRRVGLAYRELIGSLYESWTIGIGRVYKWLIHSIIQRCKKWWKRGFEAKERGRGTRP